MSLREEKTKSTMRGACGIKREAVVRMKESVAERCATLPSVRSSQGSDYKGEVCQNAQRRMNRGARRETEERQ